MNSRELDHLSDHDLLVLLHERLSVHLDDHRWWIGTYRWAVLTLISVAAVLVGWAHHP